jgi:DNA repair photolyase
MEQRKTGTREWSEKSENICKGCSHNCRYCYARHNALKKFFTIKSTEEWPEMKLNTKKIDKYSKSYPKVNGVIMFPTTHDITPAILEDSCRFLTQMLKSGNKVLIVTKPHLACIQRICREMETYKKQILFRFTIGSCRTEVLRFWEPGAPDLFERVKSLEFAFRNGFRTSVSCEPLLDSYAVELFYKLEPFVTDTIWIGGMNKIYERVDRTGFGDEGFQMLGEVEYAKSRKMVIEYLAKLSNESKVRWKDSFKKIISEAYQEVSEELKVSSIAYRNAIEKAEGGEF